MKLGDIPPPEQDFCARLAGRDESGEVVTISSLTSCQGTSLLRCTETEKDVADATRRGMRLDLGAAVVQYP